jgi:RNA polymerase sigma-70 factor, ECF subfamily
LKAIDNGVDEQLVVAAAQRDVSCFAELYEKNFARVYAYISRRVQNRFDAEDLTAEVFHEALRTLARYEDRGLPFAAWLLGIAAHLLADRWRHVARQRVLMKEDLEIRGETETTVAMSDPRSKQGRLADFEIEERALLYQLVDGLPADQQRVVALRFVEQKSVREIAAELGRSEGAVKQLQFRALETLRTRMRSGHGESI